MTSSPLRRVGIIGDVHARHRDLASALEFFRVERVDAVLSVGDVVDGVGDVEASVRLLRDAGVRAVRGNHERWILAGQMRSLSHATTRDELSDASWRWIEALEPVARFETVAGALLLGHGLGSQDMVRVSSDDPLRIDARDPVFARFAAEAAGCRFAVGGHTHRRMMRRVCGVTMLNAGTLVPSDDPCVMVADFEAMALWHHDMVDGAVVPSPWQRVNIAVTDDARDDDPTPRW